MSASGFAHKQMFCRFARLPVIPEAAIDDTIVELDSGRRVCAD
jgi:hypothetical protein